MTTRETLSVQRERAILAAGLLPNQEIDPHDPLGELRSLVDTAGAIAVDELMQHLQRPQPGTFLGKGKTEQLRDLVKAQRADVVIFENDLTPSQIGNIEEVVGCKVLDRSELILDIFAARARTNEAKLQVELAQLEYTYPRLRAMWSHLERIVGGAPTGIGTRGPGEQQLEIDRRIVQRRKAELRREITRVQGRKAREVAARNVEFFSVSLVGYTNAGKSTLFNTVTDAGTYADNKLFATLSTLTRKWDLGGGIQAMLSDTVGFIRDLPHHLVASFRATLEEAIHSHLLLIVLDVSHPQTQQHLQTVMNVLDEIGAVGQQRLLVLNKVDLLEHNADLLVFTKKYPDAVGVSALTGQGVPELVERVRTAAQGPLQKLKLVAELRDGKAIHYLETRATILDREYTDNRVTLTVEIGQRQLEQLKAMGTAVREVSDEQAE